MTQQHQDLSACIRELHRILSPYMKPLAQNKNGKISINQGLLFLESGNMYCYIGTSLICAISRPYFVGLINLFHPEKASGQSVIIDNDARVLFIDSQQAFQLLKKNNAFEATATILSSNLLVFTEHIIRNKYDDTYKKVCMGIEYYLKHHSANKSKVPLAKFIMDFTGVSRSRVMYIISELKKGGYIQINEAGNPELRRKLPEAF